MTAFITAILEVVTAFAGAFGTVATELLTNPVVIFVVGIVVALLLINKVIGTVKSIGGGKKRRK